MNTDSLIFDMDGTLWDAVDTYAHCWTEVLKENGIDQGLTRADIQKYMGMEAKQIYREIFPDLSEETIEKLYTDIIAKTDELLPSMGGMIYPDVQNCIKILSTKYKLFMLSNCQKGSIRDFMNYTDTNQYFVDYIEYGSNFQPKNVNIRTLIEKHNLQAPIYIGDTDSDRKQADLAYIPFAFASWGFGKTHFYTYKFNNMQELTEYFMNLGQTNVEVIEDNTEDKPYGVTEETHEELGKSEKIEIVDNVDDLEKSIEIDDILESDDLNNFEIAEIETDNTSIDNGTNDYDEDNLSEETHYSEKKILIKNNKNS